jgi:hypothetical protein
LTLLSQLLGPGFQQQFTPAHGLRQNGSLQLNKPQQQEEPNIMKMPESSGNKKEVG